MQDRELVAAIVAGNLDGLAEAYDRYAAPLYTYCRFMLPDPRPPGQAADAVTNTFIIATVKLQGLRDPDQFPAWLHAVARNECLRQLGSGGVVPVAADAVMPEVLPPAELRERVLGACTDNTPTGRAHRVTVAHGAGAFGPTGFPKSAVSAGPRWWHEVRRHPRVAGGVAALASAVVAAGITALLVAGGPHRAQASTVALGGSSFGTSASAPSTGPGPAGTRSSPSGKPKVPLDASRGPASATATTSAPVTSPGTPGGSTSPAPVRSSSSAPAPSKSPSRSPSPSPSPTPSPPPTPGTLRVAPNELVLSAVKGKAATGTFIVTAVGGPVNFAIHSGSIKVTVAPAAGVLGSAGSWDTVTVTVKSLVAFSTRLTVDPGNLIVTVKFSIVA